VTGWTPVLREAQAAYIPVSLLSGSGVVALGGSVETRSLI
jgi:hypothetical protein